MKLKASNKQAGKKIGGTVAIFLFLTILGLFMVLPIYLTIVMSIKPVEELFIFPPKLYAIRPTFDNFKEMFRRTSPEPRAVFKIRFQQYFRNRNSYDSTVHFRFHGGFRSCKVPLSGKQGHQQHNRCSAPLSEQRYLHHAVHRYGKAPYDRYILGAYPPLDSVSYGTLPHETVDRASPRCHDRSGKG